VKRYLVVREKNGIKDCVEVIILPHKDGSGYSYVNLTKGHICPCKFKSIELAIQDCAARPEVMHMYKISEE